MQFIKIVFSNAFSHIKSLRICYEFAEKFIPEGPNAKSVLALVKGGLNMQKAST